MTNSKLINFKGALDQEFTPTPIFRPIDYEVVRTGVRLLSKLDRKIIALRFWECLTILEIASIVGRSWDEVDWRIERAKQRLRRFCEGQRDFSRNATALRVA